MTVGGANFAVSDLDSMRNTVSGDARAKEILVTDFVRSSSSTASSEPSGTVAFPPTRRSTRPSTTSSPTPPVNEIKLSPERMTLAQDVCGSIKTAASIVIQKNADELFQNFIYHTQTVDTNLKDHTTNHVEGSKTLDTEKAKQDGDQGYTSASRQSQDLTSARLKDVGMNDGDVPSDPLHRSSGLQSLGNSVRSKAAIEAFERGAEDVRGLVTNFLSLGEPGARERVGGLRSSDIGPVSHPNPPVLLLRHTLSHTFASNPLQREQEPEPSRARAIEHALDEILGLRSRFDDLRTSRFRGQQLISSTTTSTYSGSSRSASRGLHPEPDWRNEEQARFTTTSATYADGIYPGSVRDEDIKSFLEESGHYDFSKGRWLTSEGSAGVDDLIDTLATILSSIVQRFVVADEPGVEREVVNTRAMPDCEALNEQGYRICPVLVVRAGGPSFEIPKSLQASITSEAPSFTPIGFSGMATFMTVKVDAGKAEDYLDEMAPYARRVFRDQPNRIFVRCLVLTERHAYLVHFDRAGAEITPPIDIHRKPATLVRLVAGLSSTDERLLGIDTSIQWNVMDGIKKNGSLVTTDRNGEMKKYTILERIPTSRDYLFGRATTCWRVQDPVTLEELVVKDSWRLESHPAEYEILKFVKSIPGVVEMVAYEAGRSETKDMRCPTTLGQLQNRIATRVILKSYGPSIEAFTTALQMLCAIRDAIAGHQSLVVDSVGILHRDISAHNVLLGRADAPEGQRGVLIDFDLAFRATQAEPAVKVDHKIGVRIFQSLSILGSFYNEEDAMPHDYLDDLESFFYVLVYILLRYRPDGSRISSKEENDGPSILASWADPDSSKAHAAKDPVFSPTSGGYRVGRLVTEVWGPICGELFKRFCKWMMEIISVKERLESDSEELAALLSQREEHYSAVLAMFDDAIEALKVSDKAHPPSKSTESGTSDAKVRSTAPSSAVPSKSPRSLKGGPKTNSSTPPRASSCSPASADDSTKPSEAEVPTPTLPVPPQIVILAPIAAPSIPELRRSTRLRNLRLAKEEPSRVPSQPPPQPERPKRKSPMPATSGGQPEEEGPQKRVKLGEPKEDMPNVEDQEVEIKEDDQGEAELNTDGAGTSKKRCRFGNPKGDYKIPCDQCARLKKLCQYITEGRACYACRKGKIKCSKNDKPADTPTGKGKERQDRGRRAKADVPSGMNVTVGGEVPVRGEGEEEQAMDVDVPAVVPSSDPKPKQKPTPQGSRAAASSPADANSSNQTKGSDSNAPQAGPSTVRRSARNTLKVQSVVSSEKANEERQAQRPR
ncbi:hypothetical protein NMY22_g14456 [Coprinellus aureogranulatus]|nr:hypothetical protein NMY22_g14456 [Coprinellus aureogranulatus]